MLHWFDELIGLLSVKRQTIKKTNNAAENWARKSNMKFWQLSIHRKSKRKL